MKLLYGTTNKGKVLAMEVATKPLGIELISLQDLNCGIPAVTECGDTPLENACIKARTYYNAFHMPVFSCDSGLYFEELSQEEQPGLHVRRVGGRELTDEEMIQYYGDLAKKHGGKLTGRYYNAICLVLDDNTEYASMDISLATEAFHLVPEALPQRVEGFPIDAMSKDIATGKYFYDLPDKDVSTEAVKGCGKFFQKYLSSNNDMESLSDIVVP